MAAQIRTDGLVDAQRLRQALNLLREAGEGGLTKAQLARKLGGLSLRTVDRAIKLLEGQGARIAKARCGRPAVLHFSVDRGPAWDEQVSSEAHLALRLFSLNLSHGGTQLWDKKLQILEKLSGSRTSNRDGAVYSQLKLAPRAAGGDSAETPDVLEAILRGLEGPRELELEYQPVASKKAAAMTVVPFSLAHDLFSGGAFLLAWDPKGKRPVLLRLARIQKAKTLPKMATIPEPALMERTASYQIGGWTSAEPPFTVKVRIEGAAWVQALLEAPPILPDFACSPLNHGESAVVSFKANHGAGASRWLLQFGDAAEVLEPEWLRKEIAARLSAAAGKYKKGKK